MSFYLGVLILLFNIFYFFYSDSFIKILLGMEFMGVSLMFLLFILIDFYNFILYFLIFAVCEGVLGLTILIMLFKYYGFDHISFDSIFNS